MTKAFTLAELAQLTHSRLVGDPAYVVSNVADLESAGAEDASFLANPNYEKAMRTSHAGVVFVSPQDFLVDGRNFLVSDNPSRAFQHVVELIMGEVLNCDSGFEGIHPTAVIHETATVGAQTAIGPRAVIERGVVIGERTVIGAGCYVGVRAKIGNDTHLYANVTIRERCLIGNRVIIQPGAVIGACGFGYTTDSQGRHIKINQVGIVIIEDDVEIGANTTIDRSRFQATKIGQGSKIDNLVQIAHGVIIGPYNLIVAQSGIAGSTKTGRYVMIAGQAAVAGHLTLTDKTMIAGKSAVSKSIMTAGKYGGIPAMPLNEHNRNSVYLRNIETYITELKALQKRVAELERPKS